MAKSQLTQTETTKKRRNAVSASIESPPDLPSKVEEARQILEKLDELRRTLGIRFNRTVPVIKGPVAVDLNIGVNPSISVGPRGRKIRINRRGAGVWIRLANGLYYRKELPSWPKLKQWIEQRRGEK